MRTERDIIINRLPYLLEHKKEPRGFGAWAFRIGGEQFKPGHCMSYSTALAEACRFARQHRTAKITVLP